MSTDDTTVETDDLGPETTVWRSGARPRSQSQRVLHLTDECRSLDRANVVTETTLEAYPRAFQRWCNICADGVEEVSVRE